MTTSRYSSPIGLFGLGDFANPHLNLCAMWANPPQQCQERKGAHRLDLAGLLIAPIQRIPRYELLLSSTCTMHNT